MRGFIVPPRLCEHVSLINEAGREELSPRPLLFTLSHVHLIANPLFLLLLMRCIFRHLISYLTSLPLFLRERHKEKGKTTLKEKHTKTEYKTDTALNILLLNVIWYSWLWKYEFNIKYCEILGTFVKWCATIYESS